jgi:hypothetical protein
MLTLLLQADTHACSPLANSHCLRTAPKPDRPPPFLSVLGHTSWYPLKPICLQTSQPIHASQHPPRVLLCAESPQWRRGPPAKPILCNACGTRYRRTHHLGPPIPSGGRVGGPRPPGNSRGSSGGSSGGSTPGRKRAAAAEALGPAPLPVNYEGGVHTGTRLARNPHRPAKKHYKPDSEDE